MAGHSRWRTLQAKRLAETGDAREHPEYEQAGRDLRLGDQLRAIRRRRNLTQNEVAERAGISQPALSRIELGGGVPDIETLRRLGDAMGVRFHVIIGNEEAEHEENLLVSLATPRLARSPTEIIGAAGHRAHFPPGVMRIPAISWPIVRYTAGPALPWCRRRHQSLVSLAQGVVIRTWRVPKSMTRAVSSSTLTTRPRPYLS